MSDIDDAVNKDFSESEEEKRDALMDLKKALQSKNNVNKKNQSKPIQEKNLVESNSSSDDTISESERLYGSNTSFDSEPSNNSSDSSYSSRTNSVSTSNELESNFIEDNFIEDNNLNNEKESKKVVVKPLKKKASKLDSEKIFVILTKLKEKATCRRMKTSAVIIQNNKVIVSGVNTAIKGANNCLEVGCLVENNHCHRTICAEQHCLYFVLKKNIVLKKSVLWSLHYPCRDCLKAIIASGIKEIHYFFDYTDEANKILTKEYEKKGLVKIVREEAL